MESSVLQFKGEEVSFLMQCGLIKDTVRVDSSELTSLKILKDIACQFLDQKQPGHGLNRLAERLTLFRHDYSSPDLLLPINGVSEVTEGTLIEIIVSDTSPDPEPTPVVRAHALSVHSYLQPTFCDFCGEMLMGLIKQGLKCKGCRLNCHKRCAYKIPTDCCDVRNGSIRSTTNLMPNSSTYELPLHGSASIGSSMSYLSLASTPRDRNYSIASSNISMSSMDEKDLAGRIRVPHTFVVHSYKLPTVCQHCKKLLTGLFKQGLQCKDCKFNVHRKCVDKIPMDCTGEESSPKTFSTETSMEEKNESDFENDSYDEKSDDQHREAEIFQNKLEPMESTGSSNIPLMRIVQSVKHMKRRGSKVLKDGWVWHYTNRDNTRKHHFWRLDVKALTMFQNDSTSKYFKEILLTEISQINWNRLNNGSNSVQNYCFEIKTTNCVYYVGDEVEVAKTWETAIRQALMPITATAPEGTDANHNQSAQDYEQNCSPDISTQYQIFPDAVLGSGQFGIVYAGVHNQSGRSVAIKVIDKLRFPTKQEAQLKNEVSILQNIRYAGVVNLEKMFETPERIFVVMEKLSGDMLEMIMSSKEPLGRLTERITKFLIYQILTALKYLHSNNICHCDLKPENVLLTSVTDRFPQIKLCDFGFARIIGEKSFRKSVVGTPAYLAPEVLRNKGYNKSLDMWSVGVIIYVSLSGTFPYNEEEDITEQITNAAFMYPPIPWNQISPDARKLINNLLQVKTRNRLTVNKSLSDPWLDQYQVWCDLKALEAKVGQRWLTHESDDPRWELYRQNNEPNNKNNDFVQHRHQNGFSSGTDIRL